MEAKIYEIGRTGGLVPLIEKFTDLPVGTFLQWGGNAGFPETLFCIVRSDQNDMGTFYSCFNVDKPESNAMLQRVEARSIRQEDDPSVWHGQHYFIQPDPADMETVAGYLRQHYAQAADFKSREEAAKDESDRLEAIGRELWPSLIGKCESIIIAEYEEDVSDSMTDYFASRTTRRVILAPSQHSRDLFPEMRKAAARFPETSHMGPGRGRFSPFVEIRQDFSSNGSCYYAGSRSHWHNEAWRDENGRDLVFTTRTEAEAFIASKGEPDPISFDGQVINFGWNIQEDEIEHREKYSMGKGYYLGTASYSGWQVSKQGLRNGEPGRQNCIALALCHDHLTSKGNTPEAPAQQKPGTMAGAFSITHDRDWTWIHFPDKPEDSILETLRQAGARWSLKRKAWYLTRTATAAELGLA